jgi:hypothetical protein
MIAVAGIGVVVIGGALIYFGTRKRRTTLYRGSR